MKQRKNKKPSVASNYIMNSLLSVFNLLVPLVTTPYIARKLGSQNLGIYSYCMSFRTFFAMIGMLGIPLYAKREIASSRGDSEKLNRTFSELLTLQAGFLLASLLLYTAFVIATNTPYRGIFLILEIEMLSNVFEVSWLYLGMEDFSAILWRGVTFKSVFVILIFLLVRDEGDLPVYTFSIALSNCFCNVWLFISARKYVKYHFPSFRKALRHLRLTIILLLPDMVTKIYAIIDKAMLGALSGNMSEVGFYEQSQKIVGVVLALATSLGAVLMPRLSLLYSEGKREEFHGYIDKGCSMICFISMPLAVGCFCVGSNLVPWFFGPGFEKVVGLLMVFSPMLVFMGLNDLIGVQAFVATRKERRLLIINVITTAINLSLNTLLIPRYLAVGAAYATVISEAAKCAIFLAYGKSYLSYSVVVKSALKYGATALAMGFGLQTLQATWLGVPSVTHTVFLTLCGGFLYASILLLVRDQWMLKSLRAVFGFGRRAGGGLFRK